MLPDIELKQQAFMWSARFYVLEIPLKKRSKRQIIKTIPKLKFVDFLNWRSIVASDKRLDYLGSLESISLTNVGTSVTSEGFGEWLIPKTFNTKILPRDKTDVT